MGRTVIKGFSIRVIENNRVFFSSMTCSVFTVFLREILSVYQLQLFMDIYSSFEATIIHVAWQLSFLASLLSLYRNTTYFCMLALYLSASLKEYIISLDSSGYLRVRSYHLHIEVILTSSFPIFNPFSFYSFQVS